VLDVAHNPHAAAVLAANLDQMGFFPKTIAVVGMVSGKDAQEVFRRIGDRVDHWCLASLDGPETNGRPRPAESLAEALKEALPQAAFTCYSDPASALGAAREMVEPNDRIVAFGSFLTVSHILSMRYAR
jgi:dihydrofolate synthase/folylpolyglutamate synthase